MRCLRRPESTRPMSSCYLYPAFHWKCEKCNTDNFEKAKSGFLDTETAETMSELIHQYETLDAASVDDEMSETPYLVTRVVMGPAFVKCSSCGAVYATKFEEFDHEKDEESESEEE